MRAMLTRLLVAVLLGLVLPATALAAPAITITPGAIPRGGATTVTGTGFTPNAALELFVVLSNFQNARVKLADLTVGPDGTFVTTVYMAGPRMPRPYPLVVVSGGVDLAQATLTVTDAPSIAPERLTVTPGAGPAGTRFTATGVGLTAGITVTAFTTESALGPRGHFRQVAKIQVPADGRVSFSFDTTGYSAESFDLIVYGPGGPQIGLPLVITPFMVTAAGGSAGVAQVPAQMPSTGGGAGAANGWALLGLLVAGLGGTRLIAQRRRR